MIDSEPISEDQFAQYFSTVWHALEDEISKPTYFRFLTLMSFHVFLQENVDTAIYEVGVGGRYDSTNIVERPTVTGITRLGIDHVKSLGPTIDRIAWHKAGIMKGGAAAFTVDQVPEAMKKLRECAKEQKVRLEIVPVHPSLENEALRPFQKQNASVAIALSKEALKNLGIVIDPPEDVPKKMIESINATVWKGRCQKVTIEGNHWYLDCAHTEESLQEAGSWFREASREYVCHLYSLTVCPDRLKGIFLACSSSINNPAEMPLVCWKLFTSRCTRKQSSIMLSFARI